MIKTKKLTLIQYNWMIYRPYSNFNNCPTNVLFLDHEPIFNSLVSLASFHLGQFLSIFLFFMTLTLFLRVLAGYFVVYVPQFELSGISSL